MVAGQQGDAHLAEDLKNALLQRLLVVALSGAHADGRQPACLDEVLGACGLAPLPACLEREVGAHCMRSIPATTRRFLVLAPRHVLQK